MFFTYCQNNSGGVFDQNETVDVYTIVEADSADEADRRAEAIGIYFDGCEKDIDCECCGDRWERQWEKGTETPTVYGEPAHLERGVVIHYADGKIQHYK